jgi:archaellum biogenesis ATPase FlaH
MADITPDAPRLRLVTLSAVEPEPVTWLWDRFIPAGKITLLVGDPGCGKSWLSIGIAAGLSRGWHLPGDERRSEASSTVFVNYEDGIGDTIRPRAGRSDADLSRILVIDGVENEEHASAFQIGDIDALEATLAERPDVSLVVIDPVSCLLGDVDMFRDNEVRAALQPLKLLAERTGVAIVLVAHLRKGEAERALYRVSGSIGFVGLARSVLLVATDPESGRRSVSRLKGNLSEEPQPVEFDIDRDGFAWKGVAPELTAERMLAPTTGRRKASREIEDFILEQLRDGAQPAKEIIASGEERGFHKRALQRVAAALHVKIARVGFGPKGHFEWSLGIDDVPLDTHNMSSISPMESMGRIDDTGDIGDSISGPNARVVKESSRVCGTCGKLGLCVIVNGGNVCDLCARNAA